MGGCRLSGSGKGRVWSGDCGRESGRRVCGGLWALGALVKIILPGEWVLEFVLLRVVL